MTIVDTTWPIFAIFASGLIASLVGLRLVRTPRNFNAGVALALAIVHVISESHDRAAELELAYPLDSWCVVGGVVLALAVDSFLEKHRREEEPPHHVCVLCRDMSTSTQEDVETGGDNRPSYELLKPLLLTANKRSPRRPHQAWGWILEAACASHSVLVGIALAQGGCDVTLTIALCFHQAIEGIAMSSWLSDSVDASLASSLLATVAFALMAPIGIVVQQQLQQRVDAPYASVVLDGLSGGFMIYAAMTKMVENENTGAARCVVEFVVGAALMSALALWA